MHGCRGGAWLQGRCMVAWEVSGCRGHAWLPMGLAWLPGDVHGCQGM